MKAGRMPLLCVCVAAALAIGGCRAATDEPTPTAPASASASVTGSTTAGSPTGTPAPTTPGAATPSASPTASGIAGELGWSLVGGEVFGPADVISDAALAGSTLVAVGSAESEVDAGGAQAWYSTDGSTWQPADALDGAELAAMEGVAAGPSGLVAVGFAYTEIDVAPAVWQSADGRSWTRVATPTQTRGQMTAIAYGVGGYVALGADFTDGSLLEWTSADGLSWSTTEVVAGVETGASIIGVIATATAYVCFGTSAAGRAAVWTSLDGRTWTAASALDAPADSAVNDVLATPAGLVAVGAAYEGDLARTLAWISTDGASWTSQMAGLDGEMIDVEMVGGSYLAVGARPEADELRFHAAAWTSADGVTWQPLADDPSFGFARMFELLPAGAGVVVLGERALDLAGEELAPAVWLGTPR